MNRPPGITKKNPDCKIKLKEEGRMGIQPEGEHIRKAVKWISEERQYNPGKATDELVSDACVKFDLTPVDEESLIRLLTEQTKQP